MKDIIDLLKKELTSSELISCSLSSPFSKSSELKSITLRPLKNEQNIIKAEFKYIKHNDIKSLSIIDIIDTIFLEKSCIFKQIYIKSSSKEIQILINKKGKYKLITNEISQSKSTQNRKKSYIIPEGVPCDFLIEIGVMDNAGKVKTQHYKKFKQINRFLEIVNDMFKGAEKQDLHLVDFGCGKSYLTFALYYYFKTIKTWDIQITGVDLKQEVIDHCNSIAQKLNYAQLNFVHGFIHSFEVNRPIDFVVTLHACDTATDDAILFSLKHNVDQMMFVPCCQHELNQQIENSSNSPLLKYGILKDRLTALITDSMRSQILEQAGYKVQCMEFIDLEHTAKNILLRCKKTTRPQSERDIIKDKYLEFKHQWSITPYLEKAAIKSEFITL